MNYIMRGGRGALLFLSLIFSVMVLNCGGVEAETVEYSPDTKEAADVRAAAMVAEMETWRAEGKYPAIAQEAFATSTSGLNACPLAMNGVVYACIEWWRSYATSPITGEIKKSWFPGYKFQGPGMVDPAANPRYVDDLYTEQLQGGKVVVYKIAPPSVAPFQRSANILVVPNNPQLPVVSTPLTLAAWNVYEGSTTIPPGGGFAIVMPTSTTPPESLTQYVILR